MLQILCMGLVLMLFFAVMGVSLLNRTQVAGYNDDNDNFDSVLAALLSLFVLTTEENFPYVADPAFKQRPLVSKFSTGMCTTIISH
jgi:Ion transport protein